MAPSEADLEKEIAQFRSKVEAEAKLSNPQRRKYYSLVGPPPGHFYLFVS